MIKSSRFGSKLEESRGWWDAAAETGSNGLMRADERCMLSGTASSSN